MKFLLPLLALLAAPALSQEKTQVELDSHVFLEKMVTDSTGKTSVKLEEPAKVVPGDKLLFTIRYANRSGKSADNFVVTNPLPAAVIFAGGESPGAELSVDGGKSFGPLATLTVADAEGKLRRAIPADVTHVRWKFARPLAAAAADTLKFQAIVK